MEVYIDFWKGLKGEPIAMVLKKNKSFEMIEKMLSSHASDLEANGPSPFFRKNINIEDVG